MYTNSNPIDEENVKNLRKISNELEKAFGDYIKLNHEITGAAIAASIDRLTSVLHNDLEELRKAVSSLKTEG